MTVGELIEALRAFDPTTPIIQSVDDRLDFGGFDDLNGIRPLWVGGREGNSPPYLRTVEDAARRPERAFLAVLLE